jgi:hypothetical protein
MLVIFHSLSLWNLCDSLEQKLVVLDDANLMIGKEQAWDIAVFKKAGHGQIISENAYLHSKMLRFWNSSVDACKRLRRQRIDSGRVYFRDCFIYPQETQAIFGYELSGKLKGRWKVQINGEAHYFQNFSTFLNAKSNLGSESWKKSSVVLETASLIEDDRWTIEENVLISTNPLSIYLSNNRIADSKQNEILISEFVEIFCNTDSDCSLASFQKELNMILLTSTLKILKSELHSQNSYQTFFALNFSFAYKSEIVLEDINPHHAIDHTWISMMKKMIKKEIEIKSEINGAFQYYMNYIIHSGESEVENEEHMLSLYFLRARAQRIVFESEGLTCIFPDLFIAQGFAFDQTFLDRINLDFFRMINFHSDSKRLNHEFHRRISDRLVFALATFTILCIFLGLSLSKKALQKYSITSYGDLKKN